ncbi:MAG TPA: glycosyltransferase, partial [Candidatus Bathyarchaeia archaeon]|nr:glycosyltransferase [Candidatus Bathyarchaeia archaeon]
MKKIVIDISRLHPLALKRGVGIYAESLVLSLQRLKDGNKYFLRQYNKTLDLKKFDLVHYPHFDPFFLTLPWLRQKPIVVTIHDLIPLIFPNNYSAGFRGKIKWQMQKFLLKKAKAIITDSKNSKKDIVNIIGFPEQKIFPIQLAFNKNFRRLTGIKQQSVMIKNKYHLPENFLMYVGDINWNKNIKGLVKA